MKTPLEIGVHVIGGPDAYPRLWGPVTHDMDTAPGSWTTLPIDAANTARLWLRAEFRDWTALGAGWLSTTVTLSDVNGWTIGCRPALIYNRPYDVPTMTSFYIPREDCVFALSIRNHQ